MGGIDLPRGRFTDALVALTVFAFVIAIGVFGLPQAAVLFGFIPAEIATGAWQASPLAAILSPLASAFIPRDILSLAFNAVFLLIAGRFVEKSVGPVGLGVIFVLGAYAGALARLVLTSGSALPSAGLNAPLFAVIGAYFMLYGVPRAIPIAQNQSRTVQIAAIALVWLAVQMVFAVVGQQFEVSVSLVEPIGGLIAGVALAQPMLRWHYRKA